MQFMFLLWGFLVFTGCSKTCDPATYWSCIEKQFSKNSCSYLLINSDSVSQSSVEHCNNTTFSHLSFDQKIKCQQKLKDDLTQNMGDRIKQLIDSFLSQCDL